MEKLKKNFLLLSLLKTAA